VGGRPKISYGVGFDDFGHWASSEVAVARVIEEWKDRVDRHL
jgi:hypothetical protein